MTKLGDKNATLGLMGHLLRLHPENPTVFDDCFTFAGNSAIDSNDLADLFQALKIDCLDNELIKGNCDFYIGKLLLDIDRVAAKKRLLDAQEAFQRIFPANHQVFEALRSALEQLDKMKRGITTEFVTTASQGGTSNQYKR